jgi:hypothetical protein
MGYVKELGGIDFFVKSTPLNDEDRKKISEIIAYYKVTGKIKTNCKISCKKTIKIDQKESISLVL